METIDLLPPPFEWVDIPAGQVTIIHTRSEDRKPQWIRKGWVTPTVTLEVPPFKIAKYPITNAQFEVFLNDANGYAKDEWWGFSEPARKWHLKHREAKILKPKYLGDLKPRIDVCWYEAVAFCCWLGTRTGDTIRLLTDWEWERAAKGDKSQRFPWGNDADTSRCNVRKGFALIFGRSSTTPVTQYPNGASPYGVMDMMGNVSEWCFNAGVAREEFVIDPYSKFGGKMIKGSSHIDALGWGLGPVVIPEGIRSDTIGFRVMCGDGPVWTLSTSNDNNTLTSCPLLTIT